MKIHGKKKYNSSLIGVVEIINKKKKKRRRRRRRGGEEEEGGRHYGDGKKRLFVLNPY